MNKTLMRALLSLVGILFLISPVRAQSYSTTICDSLLNVYNSELSLSNRYLQIRQEKIDSILCLPVSAARYVEVAELYRPLQCDSSLLYYARAAQEDTTLRVPMRLATIRLLASAGFYGEGMMLSAGLRGECASYLPAYYEAMNRLYGETGAYGKYEECIGEHFRIADLYRDSLIQVLGTDTGSLLMSYKFRLEHSRNVHRYYESLMLCDSALALSCVDSHDYAIFAYEKAITYRELGDQAFYNQWLIRSAIADVRSGITDNGSSWMLAQLMYQRGNIEDAYRYITYSLQNADAFNARLRYIQINPILRIINDTYQEQQQWYTRGLWIALCILILLIAVVVGALYWAYRQNSKLHRLNRKLSSLNHQLDQANRVKEQYICRYLEVYSAKISQLGRMARKLEKDPDAFIKREMADFYHSFDQTFLSLHPTFISDFNALLREEEQIVPKKGELLTTELRIYALICLGIDSSAKISELLCYSPNTIYNYRARIKNAAKGDRDTFEQRVMKLGK